MLVAGHRGAAGLAPENTTWSFMRAWELGVRMVELDVRLTRDGFAICFHDDRLDRLTTERGPISERDLRDLLPLRVLPHLYPDELLPTRIPLLQQLMASIPDDTEILVELKPEAARPELLVEQVMSAVWHHAPRCRFLSFDHDLLRRLRAFRWKEPAPGVPREIYPGDGASLRLGVLTSAANRRLQIPVGNEVGAEALHCPHAAIDGEWIGEAHAAGFRVNAWTANHDDDWRRLHHLGVDEVTSDYPDQALAFYLGVFE